MHRLDLAVSEQNRFALYGQSSGGFADVVEYPCSSCSNFRSTRPRKPGWRVFRLMQAATLIWEGILEQAILSGAERAFQYERDPDWESRFQWKLAVGKVRRHSGLEWYSGGCNRCSREFVCYGIYLWFSHLWVHHRGRSGLVRRVSCQNRHGWQLVVGPVGGWVIK